MPLAEKCLTCTALRPEHLASQQIFAYETSHPPAQTVSVPRVIPSPYRLPKNLEQRQQRLTLPFETNPFETMLITITHVGCCEHRPPDAFLLLQHSLITYAQGRASRTCWTNDGFAFCSTSSTISSKNAPTCKRHKQIRVQECRKCPALVPRTRLHSDTKLILDGPAGRPWAGPKKGTPAGMCKVQRGYFELRAKTGSTSLSVSKPQGPV